MAAGAGRWERNRSSEMGQRKDSQLHLSTTDRCYPSKDCYRCDKIIGPKATCGGRGLFGFHSQSYSPGRKPKQEFKPVKNLEAGADARALEGAVYQLARPAFLET